MSALRWFKFDPLAWRSDPALRCVSLAARGLWIEMLGIMHAAPERGVLTINGKAPSVRQIAANVNATVAEVEAVLAELEENEVCSRTPEGMICSRRMLRDTADQLEAAAAGALGAERRWGRGGARDTPIAPPMGEGNTSARARAPLLSSLSGSFSGSDSPLEGTANPAAVPVGPLPSESPSADTPKPKRPARAKPAIPWVDVLADPEFEPLRSDAAWMAAWGEWIEYRRTLAPKYQVPAGPTARKEFRYALKVGLDLHARAIDVAIRKGWKGIDVEWIGGGGRGPSASGPAKSHADRAIEDFQRMGGTFEGEMFGSEPKTKSIGSGS